MRRTLSTACLVVLMAASASAQERRATRGLSCTAVKAVVAQQKSVVLASSETAYDLVYADGNSCLNVDGESSEPAYVPTADQANCFAGWRCMQRSSDGSSSR